MLDIPPKRPVKLPNKVRKVVRTMIDFELALRQQTPEVRAGFPSPHDELAKIYTDKKTLSAARHEFIHGVREEAPMLNFENLLPDPEKPPPAIHVHADGTVSSEPECREIVDSENYPAEEEAS